MVVYSLLRSPCNRIIDSFVKLDRNRSIGRRILYCRKRKSDPTPSSSLGPALGAKRPRGNSRGVGPSTPARTVVAVAARGRRRRSVGGCGGAAAGRLRAKGRVVREVSVSSMMAKKNGKAKKSSEINDARVAVGDEGTADAMGNRDSKDSIKCAYSFLLHNRSDQPLPYQSGWNFGAHGYLGRFLIAVSACSLHCNCVSFCQNCF